jgi:integrase
VKSKTVKVVVEMYLEALKAKRSTNTYRFYAGRLSAFVRVLGDKKCRDLKAKHIEQYLHTANHWPDGTEKAPDTIRANVIAFEQWQKYAVKVKELDRPVLDDIEKPAGRMRERLPTEAEVEQIKAQAAPAFRLVYQALRQCGARPNELARATVAHWDRDARQIVLTEHKTARKTGQARRIAVGDKLQGLLTESLGDRTSGPLFVTPTGKPWTTESLSSSFRKARNAAGLDRSLVLYSARHEHGTAVYRLAGELAAATALGHSGTGMLKRYVKISREERCNTQDQIGI